MAHGIPDMLIGLNRIKQYRWNEGLISKSVVSLLNSCGSKLGAATLQQQHVQILIYVLVTSSLDSLVKYYVNKWNGEFAMLISFWYAWINSLVIF